MVLLSLIFLALIFVSPVTASSRRLSSSTDPIESGNLNGDLGVRRVPSNTPPSPQGNVNRGSEPPSLRP
ncbi:hypothetical protein H6P81_008966 [Aristolochia fimbriata]|uniref:Secreted protein n=1 Tax=Aristolochia fimbriata TaxID=158543 RepID=A0AAV7EKS1_ARIFI|nr:hypothetical protein H6P81_008966 [Aristolochia fimbriata]